MMIFLFRAIRWPRTPMSHHTPIVMSLWIWALSLADVSRCDEHDWRDDWWVTHDSRYWSSPNCSMTCLNGAMSLVELTRLLLTAAQEKTACSACPCMCITLFSTCFYPNCVWHAKYANHTHTLSWTKQLSREKRQAVSKYFKMQCRELRKMRGLGNIVT